jgi:hypothetical protein
MIDNYANSLRASGKQDKHEEMHHLWQKIELFLSELKETNSNRLQDAVSGEKNGDILFDIYYH